MASGVILFYDGPCGLCTRWVQWLAKQDRRRLLRFAPLEGSTARKLLPLKKQDSVVLWEDGQLSVQSEAVLRAVERVGGWQAKMARVLRKVPQPWRDFLYDTVAKNRHRVAKPGPLPASDDRFLP